MTKLASLLQNGTAIREGRWIKPGAAFGDLEIRTKGWTDEWADERNRRIGELNAKWAGDRTPTKLTRETLITLWLEFCFLDVRGVSHDEKGEEAVTKEDFAVFLSGPDGGTLWVAAQAATEAVHKAKDAIEKEVEGNSATP